MILIKLLIILIGILIINYKLNSQYYETFDAQSKEGFTNDEAIANIASIYNTGDMKVTNLTTTDMLKSGNITVFKGGGQYANKADTHFPWTDGKNYIRGETVLDGKLTHNGDLTQNGVMTTNGLTNNGTTILKGNVIIDGNLTVKNGSNFSGGRHFFRDEENAPAIRIGGYNGQPGIYADGPLQIASRPGTRMTVHNPTFFGPRVFINGMQDVSTELLRINADGGKYWYWVKEGNAGRT